MRAFNSVLLLGAIQTVYGWGELGHRTVAYLAAKHLTSDASQMVHTLLENDHGWDISDGAIWADAIRHRYGFTHTGAWHFIDAKDDPPYRCGVNYTRDCKEGPGCVVSAIVNMTARVNDPSLDSIQQKQALMFVMHFIGDIHQPLHTEDLDRGGNGIQVCFDGHCARTENLHSVWDSRIAHKYRDLPTHENDHAILKAAAARWADELYDANPETARRKVVGGEILGRYDCDDVSTAQKCALEWATESNAWICGFVLKPSVHWVENNDLGGEYYEGAAPIVDHMIGQAGYRLGAWLNALAVQRTSNNGLFVQGERMEM